MKMNSIRLSWEKLSRIPEKGISRERLLLNSAIECYAAINRMTNVRMLQIAIPPHSLSPNHIRQFRGVGIHLLPEADGRTFFTLFLLDNELVDIFTLFAEDLLDKLTPVLEPEEIPAIIYNRINFWRLLFARAAGELLSPEKQQGLFGELFFLEWLLDKQKDPLSVIESWQGSSGSAQDFQWQKNAVEIKTSKALYPQILVSSEQQLDYTLFDKLILGVLIVFETRGSQESLLRIIKRIRFRLQISPETMRLFDLKLNQAGIPPSLEKEYNNISFSVREVRFYEVRESFPLLIPKTIANQAIHHVTYRIDGNACAPYEITEDQTLNIFL